MSFLVLLLVAFACCEHATEDGTAHIPTAKCLSEFLFTLPDSTINITVDSYDWNKDGQILLCPLGLEHFLQGLDNNTRQSSRGTAVYPIPGEPLSLRCQSHKTGCVPINATNLSCTESKIGPHSFYCRFSPKTPVFISVCGVVCVNALNNNYHAYTWEFEFLDGPNHLSVPHASLPYLYSFFSAVFLLLALVAFTLCTCFWRAISEKILVPRRGFRYIVVIYFLAAVPLIVRAVFSWTGQRFQAAEAALISFHHLTNWIFLLILYRSLSSKQEARLSAEFAVQQGILQQGLEFLSYCAPSAQFIPGAPLVGFAFDLAPYVVFWIAFGLWIALIFSSFLTFKKLLNHLYMGNSRSKVKIHQHSDHEKVMQWSILISLWILTNPFALIPYAVPLGLSHEWVYLNKPFLVVLFAMVPLLIPIGLAMLHHFLAKAAQKDYKKAKTDAVEQYQSESFEDFSSGEEPLDYNSSDLQTNELPELSSDD
jgi:hypothetical protein